MLQRGRRSNDLYVDNGAKLWKQTYKHPCKTLNDSIGVQDHCVAQW